MPRDEKEQRWLRTFAREAVRASTLGWELAFPIFLGVLVGHYLDRWLETGYVFTVGLMFLGVFAGFYNLWRFHSEMAALQRRREQARVREEEAREPEEEVS